MIRRAVATLLLLPLLAIASRAQGAGDLVVGHWVTVKGALRADGVFVASEVEVAPPENDEALTGTVETMKTPARFVLLGQEVHVSSKTEWRGIAAGDLSGARVKVEGDYRGPRKLAADTISRRDPGRDALEGRVDALERTEEGLVLKLMRFTVLVPAEATFTGDAPFAELALAPERAVPQAPTQQRDEDDELVGSLAIGALTIGGQVEFRDDAIRQQDLNDARDDDREDRDVSVRVEAVWEPSERFFALGSLRAIDARRFDQDDPDEHDTRLSVNEAYGYWRDALGSGFDVQVGRQDFDERREWLYDQNLDALRFVRSTADLRAELSVSTTLTDGGRRDQETTNWIAYLSNNDFDRHLGAYAIARDSRTSGDVATHVGARAFGEWLPQNDAWVDVAYLVGETGGDGVGALGFDVGTTWTPFGDDVWLTAGVAYGAGDGGTGGTYRQTGLNDNTDKLGGVTSFQYYGELFDPELSNLSILTLGVGTSVARKSSLDLVVHRYEQDEAVAALVNTGLRRKPDGVHTELGWEADLVFGSRAIENWLLEVVVGWFAPGDAFPGGDDAWLARFQLRYKF